MRVMTQLLVGLLWVAVLLVSPVLVSADQATYIYDDLDRLSQVIDGQGNVARYRYDVVGISSQQQATNVVTRTTHLLRGLAVLIMGARD